MSPGPVRLEKRGGVAVLWLDQPGAAVNTLTPAWVDALEEALAAVDADAEVRAAVLVSGKPDSFVLGADLGMIRDLSSPAEALALSRRAQRVLARLAGLGKPTVAAVHGPALGAGLELALACTYRLATDGPETRFALPEVRLGLVPGSGGTQELPRRIGLSRALDPLLTGRSVHPQRAAEWGLVDALIHPAGLAGAALRAARQLADGALEAEHAREPLGERLLESTPLSRQVVYHRAEERIRKKSRGNYPAPLKILDCVRTGMEEGREAGLAREARRFAQAVFSPQSRALVALFFARQAAGRNPFPRPERPTRRVAVVGAGLMGAGIAAASVAAGLDAVVKDRDLALAARAKRVAWQEAGRRVARGRLNSFERDVIQERVVPTDDLRLFSGADLAVEAVPEDLELKVALLAEVEAALPPRAVLASNTSSIPIARLASGCSRPERVLGMHYFSPVARVPLVELVRADRTGEEALGAAYEVALRQGKVPIVVRDGPGFYTTRVLAVYLNEALLALDQGAGVEAVDEAALDTGFVMGPLAVLDLVGLDTASKILGVLAPFFADRKLPLSDLGSRLTAAGAQGVKSGRGFYLYSEVGGANGGRRRQPNPEVDRLRRSAGGTPPGHPDLQERLLLGFVNEAHRCLEEGILASPRDGDLGAVLGLGFPPFLGGPFHYVDDRTPARVVRKLEALGVRCGARFAPCRSLRERAEEAEEPS